MSRVLSSGGKPERERMRVTQAERDIANIGLQRRLSVTCGNMSTNGGMKTYGKLVTSQAKDSFLCVATRVVLRRGGGTTLAAAGKG